MDKETVKNIKQFSERLDLSFIYKDLKSMVGSNYELNSIPSELIILFKDLENSIKCTKFCIQKISDYFPEEKEPVKECEKTENPK